MSVNINGQSGTARVSEFLPQYINAKQLADMLGIAPSTLERRKSLGELPASVKIGRARRWKLSAVQDWLKEIESENITN